MSCKNEGSTHYGCDCVMEQLRAADRLAVAGREYYRRLNEPFSTYSKGSEKRFEDAISDYGRLRNGDAGEGVNELKCEHCFCQTAPHDAKDHIVCCMCGTRRLKNPVTY